MTVKEFDQFEKDVSADCFDLNLWPTPVLKLLQNARSSAERKEIAFANLKLTLLNLGYLSVPKKGKRQ